jgi:isopenicillin N synthase-like dioxygenase
MEIYAPPVAARSIPLIDLADTDEANPERRREVAQQIRRACIDVGFFYVSHHGVADGLIARQFAAAEQVFRLPIEEKMALHMRRSPSLAGYEPVGEQVLDSQDTTTTAGPSDLKESFHCATDFPDDHPLVQAGARGYGHNQWPAALPAFRTDVTAYFGAVHALADHILSLLALSLHQSDDWFEPFYAQAGGKLRMLRYPPQAGDARFNQIGAGAHTDWGGITILAQDDIGGLEVKDRTGSWIAATPIPGTFVINLGDLMARWTNGLYTSNMHRVRNNDSARDRYSMAFFYSPRPDAVIEAIPSCVSDEQPRRFDPCTAGEHTEEMFRRSYGYGYTTAPMA